MVFFECLFLDLLTLLPEDPAVLETAQSTLKLYNSIQMVTVTLPDTTVPVIVSEHGFVHDTNQYLDPRARLFFTLDPVHLVRFVLVYKKDCLRCTTRRSARSRC